MRESRSARHDLWLREREVLSSLAQERQEDRNNPTTTTRTGKSWSEKDDFVFPSVRLLLPSLLRTPAPASCSLHVASMQTVQGPRDRAGMCILFPLKETREEGEKAQEAADKDSDPDD